MKVRAGYKRTEVGVIPDDWIVRSLESVSVISRLAGAEYTSAWEETPDGEITALRGFNIGKGKIIEKDFVRISNELSLKLKRSRLCKGDVVYPCVGSIGNAAVITEDCKYHIQQNIARITPNSAAISSRYLANYLMSFLGEREVLRFNASSSQPSVLVGSLRQYRVPFPPTKAEQKAIAEALSDADALIEALEQLIAKKRQIKQGAMQELLTGKRRLPGFSGEWEVKTLHDVCQKIQDGTHFSPKPGGNDYLYVTSKNIRFGKLDMSTAEHISAVEHFKIYARCDVKKGDLLLTKDGANTGNAALNPLNEPFSLLSSVAMLRFDSRHHVSAYFMFQILSTYGQAQIKEAMSGNAITRLTLDKIRALRFPVAPLPEQTAIAAILSDMDAELAALEEKLTKARQVKQGMMQELLTGRIRLI